jgi:hypothetical protein
LASEQGLTYRFQKTEGEGDLVPIREMEKESEATALGREQNATHYDDAAGEPQPTPRREKPAIFDERGESVARRVVRKSGQKV